MGNLLAIIGMMCIFAGLGIMLMTRYSFRQYRTRFLAGLTCFLIALLIALILVLAFLDY